MKRTYMISLFLVLITGICFSSSQWTTYTNDILNFRINYPIDWKKDVWLKQGDTQRFDSYCFGMIYNNKLKVEFIYITKKGQDLRTFVKAYTKSYADIISINSIKTNNVPGIRVGGVVEGEDGDGYLLSDFYEYNKKLILIFNGYLYSSESLNIKDKDYYLLEKILNSYKRK